MTLAEQIFDRSDICRHFGLVSVQTMAYRERIGVYCNKSLVLNYNCGTLHLVLTHLVNNKIRK